MIQTSNHIAIAAAPEVVFPWLDDPQRVLQWVPQMVENQHQTPAQQRVGTQIQQRFRYRSGEVTTAGEIVAFEPNQQLGMQIQQRMMRVQVDYRLQAAGEQTIVTQHVAMRFDRWWQIPTTLAAPLIRWIARKRIAYNLGHLKQAVEHASHTA